MVVDSIEDLLGVVVLLGMVRTSYGFFSIESCIAFDNTGASLLTVLTLHNFSPIW